MNTSPSLSWLALMLFLGAAGCAEDRAPLHDSRKCTAFASIPDASLREWLCHATAMSARRLPQGASVTWAARDPGTAETWKGSIRMHGSAGRLDFNLQYQTMPENANPVRTASVLFEKDGQSVLSDAGKTEVARFIAKALSTVQIATVQSGLAQIVLEAYTAPSETSTHDLALARAQNVAQAFLDVLPTWRPDCFVFRSRTAEMSAHLPERRVDIHYVRIPKQ